MGVVEVGGHDRGTPRLAGRTINDFIATIVRGGPLHRLPERVPRSRSPMPEDTTGVLAHRVLESHWPTVVVLGLVSAAIVWTAFGRDDRRLLLAGVATAVVALAIAVIGGLVTTDRERAMAATEAFVARAVDGDIDEMIAWLHPDATLHAGRIESPGHSRESLVRALEQLDGRHRITDNTITLLDAADDGSGAIWVELACLTNTSSSSGIVPSRWIFEWSPAESGRPWEIRSLTAVSVAGRTPDGRNIFR